jgi:predicted DNA-binding protein
MSWFTRLFKKAPLAPLTCPELETLQEKLDSAAEDLGYAELQLEDTVVRLAQEEEKLRELRGEVGQAQAEYVRVKELPTFKVLQDIINNQTRNNLAMTETVKAYAKQLEDFQLKYAKLARQEIKVGNPFND